MSSAFVDSEAADNFIDIILAKSWKITLVALQNELTLTSLDNKSLGSGQITHCTIPITVDLPRITVFSIIVTPEFPVILGYPWLVSHNPQIDWPTSRFAGRRCACSTAGNLF